MKRSVLIAALMAENVEGIDDPEVYFNHPDGYGDQRINFVRLCGNLKGLTLDYDHKLDPPVEPAKPKYLTQVEREEKARGLEIRRYALNANTIRNRAEKTLSPFMGDSTFTVDQILHKADYALLSDFRDGQALRELLLVAEGLRVVGGKARIIEPSTLAVQWESEFWPRARWKEYSDNCLPLGFYEEFDLYVGIQPPLPATLIARYGRGDGDYQTFNPALMGWENIHKAGAHFVEAERRAVLLGIDLDTV